MINRAPGLDQVRPRKSGPTGAGAKGTKGNQRARAGGLMRRIRARAVMLIATSSFTAIMVGVVLNATVFQKGHHPAPLFRPIPTQTAAALPPPPPLARAQPAAILAAAPAPLETAAQKVAPEPVAAPVAPVHASHPHAAPPIHAAAAPAHSRDAIAQLLNQAPQHAASAHPAASQALTSVPRTAAKQAVAQDHRRPGAVHAAQDGRAKASTPPLID